MAKESGIDMLALIELKRRHEAGEQLTKPAQGQIKQQLKRVCKKHGCREPLAFKRKSVEYCTPEHAKKKPHKKPTKAQNRRNKQRYYERHGIKFDKTVRLRDYKPGPNSTGMVYTDQTLLYENYKEPLKAIERSKGYGYYGTVALSEDRTLVQCHICGNLFSSVAQHLKKHKITSTKYKEMYGLAVETALVSEPIRERLQLNAVKHLPQKGELPVWLQEYADKVKQGEAIAPARIGKSSFSLERRNKLGLKSAKEVKEHTSEELLENLVKFKEQHGRIPMTSDFNRGLLGAARGTYIARFGSLNNARIEAGLNAVLPMPFGQIVEMSPEDYREYKSGYTVSKDALRQRKRRQLKRLQRHDSHQ